MKNIEYKISETTKDDKSIVAAFVAESWGSPLSVTRGKIHNTSELPGFIVKSDNKIIGLVTYNIQGKDCEIVTLNSIVGNKGIGTRLIDKVIEKAKSENCKRVWLITTNDNTKAIRFYQRRGFEWAGFHKNSMEESRKLKPEIPELGDDDIPIKHEIEFELILQ